MEDKDLYLIASRLNGQEHLVLKRDRGQMGILSFLSLDEAKGLFKEAYRVLTNVPPPDISLYKKHFEQMAGLYPVIIKLNWSTSFKVIDEWRMDTSVYQVESIRFVSKDIYYTRMKSGFIDQFEVLDIIKDIASIPSIGPDGKMVFQKITINNNIKGKLDPKPLTPEEGAEIARQRGFL